MSEKKPNKRRSKRRKQSIIRWVLLAVIIIAAVLAVLIRLGVIEPKIGPFSLIKQPAAKDASTSVRFIDVGQGDCTLIVSGGQAMLIDSGESDPRNSVISYIESLDIHRLEYIIVTHPHSDHMGEMADIINSFEVGRVIMPRLPDELTPSTYAYERLLGAIDQRGVPLSAAANESFSLGEITVDTYIPSVYGEDLNNCSVVTRLTHGGNSFLVTGDCSADEERDLILHGADLKADVLRVGHHGSSSATSEEFLLAVRPAYAVISCGKDNDYGHPAEKTLMKLSASVGKIYITKDSGTVTFVSDGKGLTVYTERE